MEDADGASALSWDQLKTLFKEIKDFNWNHVSAEDIHDLAVISLFGALRISETTGLAHDTSFWLGEHHLELGIFIYDAKNRIGTKPNLRILHSFTNNPNLCAVRAWKRLAKKYPTGFLARRTNGNKLTSTKLSSEWKRFTDSLKTRKIFSNDLVLTWHLLRVSYVNLATTSIEMPIYWIMSGTDHRAKSSHAHYAAQTAVTRKRQAAETFTAGIATL